jgi:diadenylate cyclase
MFQPLGESIFSGFWLAQLADVLIIAIIIRIIIGSLWKTPAMTVILVFAAVLLTGVILRELRFFTIGFLIEKLSGVMFIAVVVIFASEIKDILRSMGRYLSRKFYGRVSWTDYDTIDSLVETCGLLRERKLGGLFVLERSESLDGLYSDGVELEKLKVQPDLVASMLTPPGPLHDGAIVIRDDRMVRASAILPLTVRTAFMPRLGTRHRAALGIGEQSDAVAVVVSEETGTMKLAHDGRISEPLTSDRLRERLLELMTHGE